LFDSTIVRSLGELIVKLPIGSIPPKIRRSDDPAQIRYLREHAMTYIADSGRYEGKMQYRRTGRSGLDLPVLSLGYWHNFGDDRPFDSQRAISRRGFDLGITHHDLANNYGPPYGSAEINFGRLMREDFGPYRDELVISTKAGWDMWPGPYGQGGGSRKYLLASLDQSLRRMGLDYVDIFYSHRLDASTPLEETMGALDTAVRQGKALYVGVSSYDAERTRQAHAILSDLGTPLLIHQPSYSMLNRWIETEGLLDAATELGIGVIGFTALAQGLLTSRYLEGIPEDSRAARDEETFDKSWLNDEMIERLRALNELASRRGQTLAQLALAWALRDERVTSLVIGASSVEQLEQNVDALDNLLLSADELAQVDRLTSADGGVDIWEGARKGAL
jgi:L-glyceraldehyde 3-phosphate reductase